VDPLRVKVTMKKYRYKTLKSTNETAREILEENAIIIADEQTAGKGRMGKSFFSPEGGIYMSVILKLDFSDSVYLSAAAAVSVCRAIKNLTGLSPKIKWINDIYLDEKKVGGILIEGVSSYVVVGIGLNLKPQEFPADINAASLEVDIERELLIDEIISQLFSVSKEKNFIEEYKKLSDILGEKIIVYDKNEEYTAYVTDISDIGELIIQKGDRSQILNSTNITIKKVKQ